MPTRREPMRTCVACRRVRAKGELVRVSRDRDGIARVDPAARAPGRGAYVCPDPGCVDRAVGKGALARSLSAPLPADEAARLEQVGGGVAE